MSQNATKYKNEFDKANYDRIVVNVRKGQKEGIQQYAKSLGLSLNGYINRLIEADMNGQRESEAQMNGSK